MKEKIKKLINELIDGVNKLSLPAVILIASVILGSFYYASEINKQKSIERQQEIKIEQEKQVKEEAEQLLNTCIDNAESNYSDRWHKECKAQGKLTNKCIDINELSFDEYLKKYGLTIEEYVKERNLTPINPSIIAVRLSAIIDYRERASNECSCRLSLSAYADRFNESLEKDKAECIKRYPPK